MADSTIGKQVTEEEDDRTNDGSVDRHGRPAVRRKTGTWAAAFLILVNQGLATMAFFGVGVNLVLFLTRVMAEENAAAANKVSKWTGTVYLFSLLGAFLSDSYWGRFKACVIFQLIFLLGLASLSLSAHLLLLKPRGCGAEDSPCDPHSAPEKAAFYASVYLAALGNGGYQPNAATLGADQFDENSAEAPSKVSFFTFFYLAFNLGSLFSNTVMVYYEDRGMWAPGFWAAAAAAAAALLLFLTGARRYRRFRPRGNPLPRFCQVLVAAARKRDAAAPPPPLGHSYYEDEDWQAEGGRKPLHTDGFKFLDRASVITSKDSGEDGVGGAVRRNPWRVCTVRQVEEAKCVLRLLPIWLCTIPYSVAFTQMASMFVEQGAAMRTTVSGFRIPPATMSGFDILAVALVTYAYRRVLDPLAARLGFGGKPAGGLTQLQRMGIGLLLAAVAMAAAGTVEWFRLKHAGAGGGSSLSILWQVPQYAGVGASEVFMYVGQLEFFNAEAPEGLKSFGSALCMTSMSAGNYASILMVSAVTRVSSAHRPPGWIPARDLNEGHLDSFFFLVAALSAADFGVYCVCARWYRRTKFQGRVGEGHTTDPQV